MPSGMTQHMGAWCPHQRPSLFTRPGSIMAVQACSRKSHAFCTLCVGPTILAMLYVMTSSLHPLYSSAKVTSKGSSRQAWQKTSKDGEEISWPIAQKATHQTTMLDVQKKRELQEQARMAYRPDSSLAEEFKEWRKDLLPNRLKQQTMLDVLMY